MTIPIKSLEWGVDEDGGYIKAAVRDTKAAVRFVESIEHGKEYELEVRRIKKRRSLDSNAYMWLLLGKLTAALNRNIGADTKPLTPEDVYRECIRGIGDNFEVAMIREDGAATWITNWRSRGIGWLVEKLDECPVEGYVQLVCYYGSSTYSTEQFARLLDIVRFECRQQGIETMTPEQMALIREE